MLASLHDAVPRHRLALDAVGLDRGHAKGDEAIGEVTSPQRVFRCDQVTTQVPPLRLELPNAV